MFFLNAGVYHQEVGGLKKKTLQLQQCLWCLKFLLACNLSMVTFQTLHMHEEKNAIKLWKFTLVQLSAGRGLLWDTMLLVRCSRWLKKGWQVYRKFCTAVTTVSLLTHFCLPGHKKPSWYREMTKMSATKQEPTPGWGSQVRNLFCSRRTGAAARCFSQPGSSLGSCSTHIYHRMAPQQRQLKTIVASPPLKHLIMCINTENSMMMIASQCSFIKV